MLVQWTGNRWSRGTWKESWNWVIYGTAFKMNLQIIHIKNTLTLVSVYSGEASSFELIFDKMRYLPATISQFSWLQTRRSQHLKENGWACRIRSIEDCMTFDVQTSQKMGYFRETHFLCAKTPRKSKFYSIRCAKDSWVERLSATARNLLRFYDLCSLRPTDFHKRCWIRLIREHASLVLKSIVEAWGAAYKLRRIFLIHYRSCVLLYSWEVVRFVEESLIGISGYQSLY